MKYGVALPQQSSTIDIGWISHKQVLVPRRAYIDQTTKASYRRQLLPTVLAGQAGIQRLEPP